MCGRYVSSTSPADLARLLAATDQTGDALDKADFNVAPTKTVPAALQRQGTRVLAALRWGLVPSWAKDPRIGSKLINARAETVAAKPAFRAAFARRRCLLPAAGYYEWEPGPAPKTPKQPYFLAPADGSLLMMAGLYEIWRDAEGVPLWTATVITTVATDDVGHIHDRSPMTVSPAAWSAWLDPETANPMGLITPAVHGALRAVKVSTAVSNVRNNGPELLEPLA